MKMLVPQAPKLFSLVASQRQETVSAYLRWELQKSTPSSSVQQLCSFWRSTFAVALPKHVLVVVLFAQLELQLRLVEQREQPHWQRRLVRQQ